MKSMWRTLIKELIPNLRLCAYLLVDIQINTHDINEDIQELLYVNTQ